MKQNFRFRSALSRSLMLLSAVSLCVILAVIPSVGGTHSADSTREELLEKALPAYKAYWGFYDSPKAFDVTTSNFNSVLVEGVGCVILQQSSGRPSVHLETRLKEPLKFIDVNNYDGVLRLTPSQSSLNNRMFITPYKESVKPSDYITVVIRAPKIENIVIGSEVPETYVGKFSNDGTMNFVINSGGDVHIEEIDNNVFNFVSNGSSTITIENVVTSSLSIAMNGSGILAFDKIKANSFSVACNGSGSLTVTSLSAIEANLVHHGSGIMTMDGEVNSGNYHVNGSGILELSKLRADKVSAFVRGSGTLMCNAIYTLDAYTEGSGQIIYYGNPSKVNTKGGNIFQSKK